ncbi:MAG: hypothetical protein ABI551_07320 [Polyangiaceae bacterium]
MYPLVREDVFAALVEAVRRCPNQWSFEAQAIVISLSDWLRPEDVEESLDAAEAMVRGSFGARARGRPRVSSIAQLVRHSANPPGQECRVLPFSPRRRK